jgi:hypothetical protein
MLRTTLSSMYDDHIIIAPEKLVGVKGAQSNSKTAHINHAFF